ncbi:hypothetical protein N8I77_013334 [Diaporthe amygdali]|uniref:Uncharacterized protein n=1 Tax=Phomopsis amygdali TaxID=1214568 RepID=A0AAD9S188_PHOAM|nr:hypothetical protein N8I77_013334 [Diaporthe amygdali]
MVFDAAAFYAHNEYELGIWRREMVRFGKLYFKQYLRNFPPSEPVEQFDDKNALYVLKFDLDYCLHRPGLPLVREQILADILRLVNKYPPKSNDAPPFISKGDSIAQPQQIKPQTHTIGAG